MAALPEAYQDLLKTDVAVLATIGQDGYPQVTALWFVFDDDGTIKLSLNTARQKTKNLQAHPECTLFILDPANPYRTLEIRARGGRAGLGLYVCKEAWGQIWRCRSPRQRSNGGDASGRLASAG